MQSTSWVFLFLLRLVLESLYFFGFEFRATFLEEEEGAEWWGVVVEIWAWTSIPVKELLVFPPGVLLEHFFGSLHNFLFLKHCIFTIKKKKRTLLCKNIVLPHNKTFIIYLQKFKFYSLLKSYLWNLKGLNFLQ